MGVAQSDAAVRDARHVQATTAGRSRSRSSTAGRTSRAAPWTSPHGACAALGHCFTGVDRTTASNRTPARPLRLPLARRLSSSRGSLAHDHRAVPDPLRRADPADDRRATRRGARAAGYNLFNLHADDVLIDLLTDSGTGAMSRDQWAAIQHGDESYAGSPSWFAFLESVQELFPFRHVIPTHQGRAAEKILFTVLGGPGQGRPEQHPLRHDPGERRGDRRRGGRPGDPRGPRSRRLIHPFKGNMDVDALDRFLADRAGEVPVVFVTVTNNSGGGQPVSLANLRAVRAVCDRHGVPLFLDACRFAENAWFIKLREPGQADRSIPDIVREMAASPTG